MAGYVVSDRRRLKAMEKEGLIKEPPEHVRPTNGWWGMSPPKGMRAYHYVDEGTLGSTWVRWRGWEVRIRYVDGCFFPFVMARPLKPLKSKS